MKDDYGQLLQMTCHDLLNPLSHMRFIFEAEEDNPDIFENMKGDMREAIENSIGIIEMVRKMRKASVEDKDFNLEAVCVATAVQNLSHMLLERLQEKEIELVIDIKKEVHAIVERASFLNSVLNNLLTNAIKFSKPGSCVVISARQVEGWVHITVEDSGIGMSERLIKALFKMDAVTARKGTAGETGTGYGMRLIKRFVDAYGGAIEVSSKEQEEGVTDHGTTVTLSLREAAPVS